MSEQYYLLRLWDPALPPFVSGDRMYIGSESDIQATMASIEKRGVSQETLEAYKRYVSGDKTATHSIAYRTVPILEKVKVIRSSIMSIGEHKWEHINTWNYPYYVKCDSAEITRIIVKYKKKYLRCYKVIFKNLRCENVDGTWYKLDTFFIGNQFLVDVQHLTESDFTITTLLYEAETQHDTLEEADDIDRSDNIDLKFFCDEIFGDG